MRMSYAGNSSLFNDENQIYIRELYQRYLEQPDSVDSVWRDFFQSNQDALSDDGPSEAFLKGLPHARHSQVLGSSSDVPFSIFMVEDEVKKKPAPKTSAVSEALVDTFRVDSLLNAYRRYGHLCAKLDPLGLTVRVAHEDLAIEKHGFKKEDLGRTLDVMAFGKKGMTLKDLIGHCEKMYCHHIGVEYMHMPSAKERQWFINQYEKSFFKDALTGDDRKDILTQLLHADLFENYLDKKHRGTKRFGLDGGESLIVLLEQMFAKGSSMGLQEGVIGMAHRGRLNVLANVLQKPYRRMFAEFEGGAPEIKGLDVDVSGDVKYHLGYSCDREYNGKKMHLSLMANPSHLECVNTVALGKVKAKLDRLESSDSRQVMGVLIHGDAAFIGQGVVAETFLLAGVDGYSSGGTIHIAVNNQIGFTTFPEESRSSLYCSDLAKMIDAPVFHVNGDDPEACAHVARLAMEYRQTFGKDVVIDMWCFRRHGHNEGDEPMYTQPIMYKAIKKHKRTALQYGGEVEQVGLLPAGTMDSITKSFNAVLDEAYAQSKEKMDIEPDGFKGVWSSYKIPARDLVSRGIKTGVSQKTLKEIGNHLFKAPEGFSLSNKVAKQFKEKEKSIESGKDLDWATAELLAFGSILQDGHKVRLSGEDCKRGTFSQRHAVLFDQETNAPYIPVNTLEGAKEKLDVLNSPLSEFGVLGYEYGYSLSSPHSLVIWEAQYGDFANGAQIIIDQFIASGETKWLRMSGLVMLLPHGFEGQGPEHSSARLERYLQLCAEDNMQVCNISTPANYFHALRRQLARDFLKPLVIMSPKSLFRHKMCVSDMEDMAEGTSFKRVLLDHGEKDKTLVADDKIKRVVLCSGKIYYELLEERNKQNIKDVYLLRVEQFYPFPSDAVEKELKRFKKADVVWCQEEPKNNGAWFFVRDYIEDVLQKTGHNRVQYAGRDAAAAPATGYGSRHMVEQQDLIHTALGVK